MIFLKFKVVGKVLSSPILLTVVSGGLDITSAFVRSKVMKNNQRRMQDKIKKDIIKEISEAGN